MAVEIGKVVDVPECLAVSEDVLEKKYFETRAPFIHFIGITTEGHEQLNDKDAVFIAFANRKSLEELHALCRIILAHVPFDDKIYPRDLLELNKRALEFNSSHIALLDYTADDPACKVVDSWEVFPV